MLEITFSKTVSSNGLSGLAQGYDFSPNETEKLKTKGKLFVVIVLTNLSGNLDVNTSIGELINKFVDNYYNNLNLKPFDALNYAFRKVVEEFNSTNNHIEIAASSFVDGILYSAAYGGGRVVVFRDGSLVTILQSENLVVVASGYPKTNDTILIGSKLFFEKIPDFIIKSALEKEDVTSSTEIINQTLKQDQKTENMASVAIKFKEKQITPFLSRRSIYLKEAVGDEVTSDSKKMTLSVGIILLVILIVSIGFGSRQKRINDTKKEYQNIFTEAETSMNEAINLASLDPEKSRELFIDSQAKLKEIKDLKITDPKVNELEKKINESREAILGEYEITPELFLDLGLLASGLNGNAISFSAGNIYVLDTNSKMAVSVAMESKKSKVVAGPGIIENALDLACYQDNVYILSSDGIRLVKQSNTKVVEKTWGGGALISAFAGNLYVLDKNAGKIYRFSGGSGNTFGSLQEWLSLSTKADFTNATSWTMDGAIYVLYPNSKILKYSQGSPQSFSVTGVTPAIGSIEAISADPDNQYLYLLDKKGKRVVVVDKKGKYKAQYIGDDIFLATKLVVSEAQKKIILLAGDKLLSIQISHL